MIFKSVIILLISQISLANNCPEGKQIWEIISKIDTISNNDVCLKKILDLKRKRETCKMTLDSTFAKILNITGRTYWRLGNINEALKNYKQSIQINSSPSKNASKRQLGLTYFNLGAINQFDLRNSQNALKYYNIAIKILNQYNFKTEFIAEAYRLKANIYFFYGEFQNCIQNADKALLYVGENNLFLLKALMEKVQALNELGQFSKAEILYKNAIELGEKSAPNTMELANFYSLYSKFVLKQKKINLAKEYNLKALRIFKKIDYKYMIASTLYDLGILYNNQNETKKAILYFKNSLELSPDFPDLQLLAYDGLSQSYLKEKQDSLSLKAIQKGLNVYLGNEISNNVKINPIAERIKNVDDMDYFLTIIQHKAETWLAYYHHTNKKEYLQNALETFEVADKMVDYMRREHVGYQSKLFWRDKTHSLYENAIEVCYLLKNYEMGFYFFEKARAVLLNDKINNLSANQMLSSSDQLKERGFQQEIAQLNAQIESETAEAKKSVLNVKMLDIQEAQQKFIKNIAAKYPSYYQFKYDTSMYNLGQMKQYLKKTNASFVEYFKGDSANYQLVITPTGVNIIKQKPTENLYQYLINAPDLGKRVIVSQDGEFVPLDTLKNTKGDVLLKKYAFSNTYSAQYLLRNAEKKVENGWLNNFIGFAPVNYSKSMALPSLLGADEALTTVSSNYFWPNNYQKEKASKANFSKMASNYKIIQLFTHADADNANKEPTIFFADSAMKVSELEAFGQFNTELLVLSACKTNVGKVAKGEGTLSMAREFAGLGIPATITTLWSVENEATYQITEFFYKYLKNGEPKDIALQKAKLEYLEVNSREKQDPKYWAAFVLMGETAPLAGFDGKIVYFSLLAFTIIFAISIFLYKRNRLIVK